MSARSGVGDGGAIPPIRLSGRAPSVCVCIGGRVPTSGAAAPTSHQEEAPAWSVCVYGGWYYPPYQAERRVCVCVCVCVCVGRGVLVLTSGAADLGVQVREPARGGVRQGEHLGGAQGVRLQVVVQRPVLVVVRDQEQLRPRPRPLDVRRYKTCNTTRVFIHPLSLTWDSITHTTPLDIRCDKTYNTTRVFIHPLSLTCILDNL